MSGCSRRGLRRHGGRISQTLALLLTLSCFGADAPPVPTGIPDFHQVNEHLYRGGQPAQKGLKSLATVGVHAVIDLRSAGERSEREEHLVEALGMKYYSVPLPSLGAPSDAKVAVILALLDDSNNWPVFVHCQRGKDRTGTIIACYRIRHDGWPNSRALTEAIDNGLNFTERGMKEYIHRYAPPGLNPSKESPVISVQR